MEHILQPLENIITNKFLPTLLDSIVTEHYCKMYSLPTRFGRMELPILTEIEY